MSLAQRMGRPRGVEIIAAVLSGLILLTGCGQNVGVIDRVAPEASVTSSEGIVVGRVTFVVDGVAMDYSLLNKPAMLLARYSDDQFYATPEVDRDGSFSWRIPEGPYEIAVLYGGLAELKGFHSPGGGFQQVLGLPRPGYGFVVEPGKVHYLGTLVVDVDSREPDGVLPNFTGERAFGKLNKTYVVNDSSRAAKWQAFKDRPDADVSLFREKPHP
jgi:hypothetical protein